MERSSLPTSSNKVTGMDDICSDYGKEEYPDDCSETVECVDPFDLFNTFKPLLLKHLPLRRLNWKSSNRPLRSIDTLYVDLIPAKHGTDAASAPERRHQIPGLRQTPYLKVYLLRCDSTEAYKATCRKQIRDWIKSNPLPGESKKGPSSQENHDAYEWLIVHLVFTEEADAAQSRTSRTDQLGTTDSTDSITNKSKSSGKSSLLILEKLRADFNSSSKSNVDRVAQIHIAKAGQQTSAESKEQFLDLVEKLKVTILASFDLRVRQYEDDIRERDSQRNLPGWNFNTFFILKEGLARGFENVGLFDDALIGYDELALGLEVVIREQLEGTGSDHGGRFLHCSEELKDKIQACLKDADEEASMDGQLSLDLGLDPASRLQRRDYTLDTHRSPFRDLILANDISIFDFRLYIFSRQLNLLLRNANALSIADQRSEAPPNKSEHDDRFLPLAEACQRAVDFITKGARTLRHDLELALDVSESMPTEDRTFRRLVISNYILSWTYVSALQVLAQTSSPNLVLPPAELSLERQSSVKTDVVRHRPRSLLRSPSPTKMGMAERSPRPASAIATLPSNKSNNKTGTEELAGARAELYSLARTAVEEIGNQHGWTRQWHISTSNVMQDVSLETNHLTNGESTEERKKPFINGLQHLDLRSAFRSQDTFKTLFECLTMFIYRHDLAAKRTKSSEKTMGEIATLKYEAGKYDEAASYFSSIASFHRESQWLELESMFLELYVDCLKKLGCHGEYVSNLLTLLGRPENQQLHLSKPAMATEERYMPDLWSYSDKLTTPIHAKLSNFFSIKGLAPYIQHYQDMDGFFICMKIGFLLGGALELSEGLQITLSSIHDSPMAVIVLRSGPSPITVTRLSKKVELGSNLSVCGWYAIESIQIKIGNILFIEDYSTLRKAFASDEQARPNPMAALRLFVYPPAHSLRATASPAPYLHLAQPRSILLELETGRNDIQSCDVSMKSGTAGLRLHLHETQMDSDDGSASSSMVSPREGMQAIRLVDCPADSNYKLLVPYTVENAEIPIINVKLDVEYRAVAGTFVYSTQIVVNTILPISVNVQDNFKEDALFSRFTISPATLVPLRLLKCDMQGFEDAYVVECDENGQGVMDVFPKQPASLVYRITRKEPRSMRSSPEPLALSVKFTCLDEVVLKVMEKRFIAFVTASPIVSLVQPLCAHLLSTFRSQWTAQDLEIIGLCHEIEVWAYEDLGWEPILMGFNVQVRDLAKTWLKKWHEENAVIPIYEDSQDEHPQPLRQIVIPVDFPTPAIVATASLELASRRTEALTIGEALLAEVRVSCMQNWATGDHSAEENGQLEIHFEVLAPLENWIVGGVRKGRFSAEESTKSVPVILLPQRTGHLLLPSIEVKCYKPQAERSNSSFGPARGTEVACEVDIKSLARSVHVVSGLRETVVGIDIVEAQGQVGEKRTLLVGSKGREIPNAPSSTELNASTPVRASQGQSINNKRSTEKGFLPFASRPEDVKSVLSTHVAVIRKKPPESALDTYQKLEWGFHVVFERELCLKHGKLGSHDLPGTRALRFDDHDQLVAAVESHEEAFKVLARLLEKGRAAVVKSVREAKNKRRPHPKEPLIVNVSALVKEAKNSHQNDIKLEPCQSGLNAVWVTPPHIDLAKLEKIENLHDLHKVGKLGLEKPITKCSFLGGGGGSDVIQASSIAKLLVQANSKMKVHAVISIRSEVSKSSHYNEERSVWDDEDQKKTNLLKLSEGNLQILSGHRGNARFVEDAPVHDFDNVRLVTDDKGLQVPWRPRYEKAIGDVDTIIVVDTGGDVLGGMGRNSEKQAPDQDCRTQIFTDIIAKSKDLNALVAIAAIGVDSPKDAQEKLEASDAVYYRFTDDDKKFLRSLYKKWNFDGTPEALKNYPEHYGKTPLAMLASFNLKHDEVGGWHALPLPKKCITDFSNPWSCITWVAPQMSCLVFVNQRKLLAKIISRDSISSSILQ